MMPPSRLLIVEDAPESIAFIARVLQELYPQARLWLAGSVSEALGMVRQQPGLDLAVVDLGLPDGLGDTVIAALHALQPDCMTVVYTLFDDDGSLFDALRAGAQGYLLKSDPPARIQAALAAMLAGEPPLSPKIAQRLLREFRARSGNTADGMAGFTGARDRQPRDGPSRSEASAIANSLLTPREIETLTLAAKGLRLPELAVHLNVTRATAATYLKRIYHKLSVNTRAEATLEAARLGLVRVPGNDAWE